MKSTQLHNEELKGLKEKFDEAYSNTDVQVYIAKTLALIAEAIFDIKEVVIDSNKKM